MDRTYKVFRVNISSTFIDNIYFILSGVFAIFLYVLMIVFLIFLFQTNQALDLSINNSSKISSIEIDLVNEVLEKSPKITEEKEVSKDSKDDKSNAKEVGSKSPVVGLGAGDLFKKIDTTNPNQKIQDNTSDGRDKIALNKKNEENANAHRNEQLNKILQSTQNLAQTIQNLNQNISIEDTNTSQFCNTHKDYCNKLAELLYSNWNIRSSFDKALLSIVVIKISKNGDFSYTIKKSSNNEIFDKELLESLEKLKDVKFPTLDGISFDKLEVIFRNKKEK